MTRKINHIVLVTYDGYDYGYDRKIERAAGRSCGGSGCGMGGRDIDFYFCQEKAAKRAASRIRKQCRRMSTNVETYATYDDCGCRVEDCNCQKMEF